MGWKTEIQNLISRVEVQLRSLKDQVGNAEDVMEDLDEIDFNTLANEASALQEKAYQLSNEEDWVEEEEDEEDEDE
jgi:hypothetical protein